MPKKRIGRPPKPKKPKPPPGPKRDPNVTILSIPNLPKLKAESRSPVPRPWTKNKRNRKPKYWEDKPAQRKKKGWVPYRLDDQVLYKYKINQVEAGSEKKMTPLLPRRVPLEEIKIIMAFTVAEARQVATNLGLNWKNCRYLTRWACYQTESFQVLMNQFRGIPRENLIGDFSAREIALLTGRPWRDSYAVNDWFYDNAKVLRRVTFTDDGDKTVISIDGIPQYQKLGELMFTMKREG